ncbi:GAF domain-containing protein [Halorussus halobius]|uniref:GAF domain-containing protein n=1 Tax=Halorussus halobius TaxID=1710537 RepID=UPI0010921213|nr:GAF domain-containing protein [Halorussus halobius]
MNGAEIGSDISALYIDDDRGLLELTQDFLETRAPHVDVETTASPRRGLELLDDREFDVVICDYQMTEMDGLAVLKRLREDRDDGTPFVMFTGQGREEVAVEALNLGADRYIQKGGDPTSQYDVLVRAIEQEVEHDRVQRRLRNREENLRVTLESIGDAVITTDVDGRITRLNPVAEDLTGWDADDAVGRPLPDVFEVYNHETGEPEDDPARTVLEEGRVVGLANGTRLVRRDGSERFIADSASPIENEDGETVGVVVVFRDVTEEYRARERQREQRKAVIDLSVDEAITAGDLDRGARTITETAAGALDVDRVGIWLFEDDGTVLRCVDLYERSTDAHESGAELSADEYPDYFDALTEHRALDAHDARTDSRTAALREYLESNGVTSLLDATIRSAGEVVGVVCHEHVGEPREWTDDERRFTGEVADQTLRLLTNRRRTKYEETLKELHGIATDVTAFETPEAICERTITAAETILDFDQCVMNLEDDGMLPIAAVSEELPSEGVTPMSVEEGIAGKTYRTGESFRFADAQDVEEANPQGPYRAALSVPVGDHGVFQAVSERTGTFDEDDRELAELLVSHAERALDQLEKECELRERNERLDEFAHVVSHDLRNPLNVAQGKLELARETGADEHFDDVARAHDRMLRLIDDLLALAREGETAIETRPVDLAATAERCWSSVAGGGGTLDVEADPTVRADPERLQQLLENLFRNAVEHGSAGTPTGSDDAANPGGANVTVRVGELDDGFYVEDDGPGIPAEQRDEVFEVGYSNSEAGTGFGLSIVRRIASAHGWEVSVAEGSDGGARFEITGVAVEE